jgi:hypothetical protein
MGEAVVQPTKSGRIRPMSIVIGVNRIELYLLVLSMLLGVVYLLGVPRPSSIADTFPTWVGILWYLNLLFGSGVALYGGLWPRDPVDQQLLQGLRFYKSGWLYIGAAATFYGLVLVWQVVAHHRWDATAAATLTLAYGLSGFSQANTAGHIIRRTQEKIEEVEQVANPDDDSGGVETTG